MLSPLQSAFTEHFLHHERMIRVQLIDSKLCIIDDYSTHQISLNFDTYFNTESDSYGNITSISVFGERVVHLAHPNPTILEQWASLLHQNIHKVGFHKDYALHEKIGQGVSAKVYLAKTERGGEKVAVKAFCKKKMEKKDWQALQNQIKILRIIDGHYFPKLLGTYLTQNTVYLVMEYAQGSTLKEMAELGISLREKKRILKEISIALNILHNTNIVHRDIKPQNIIYNLKNRDIKIIDFGFSVYLPQRFATYYNCGTPGYVASQTLNKDYQPCPANDVFSLGMLAHYLFTGKLPFKQNGRSILLESRDCKFTFSSQLKRLPTLLAVLKKMVCHQSQRISLNQFLSCQFLGQKQQHLINPQIKPRSKLIQNLSMLNDRAQSLCTRDRGCSIKTKTYSKMYRPYYKVINPRLITDRF